MLRADLKYWLVLGLVLAAGVAYELARPRPLDWTPSFRPDDARPYGGAALYRLLPSLVGGNVDVSQAPLRSVLAGLAPGEATLLVVDVEADWSAFEVRALLAFVEAGGTVVVAAQELAPALDDTLGIDTFRGPLERILPTSEEADTVQVQFTAAGLDRPLSVLDVLTPSGATLLAPDSAARWAVPAQVIARQGAGAPLALRYAVGAGALVFTHAPLLLTNYGLLESGGTAFAERFFAYVPPGGVVWWQRGLGEAASPLRYVLKQPSLRTALWMVLLGIGLLMIRAARRRERPVPTLAPLRNDTADFVRTIGMLYYHRADHANLAGKLRQQFHAYGRDVLHLSIPPDHPDYARHVAERSGVARAEVDRLLAHLRRSEAQPATYGRDLLDLAHDLQAFYAASSRPLS